MYCFHFFVYLSLRLLLFLLLLLSVLVVLCICCLHAHTFRVKCKKIIPLYSKWTYCNKILCYLYMVHLETTTDVEAMNQWQFHLSTHLSCLFILLLFWLDMISASVESSVNGWVSRWNRDSKRTQLVQDEESNASALDRAFSWC